MRVAEWDQKEAIWYAEMLKNPEEAKEEELDWDDYLADHGDAGWRSHMFSL